MRRLATLLTLATFVGLAACDGGPAQDEAKAAGKTPADFPQTAADFLDAMDGHVVLPDDPQKADAIRRGRNTWVLWTGGNEAFWDWLASNSYGTFDLLKTISSFPCSDEQQRLAGEGGTGYGETQRAGYDEAEGAPAWQPYRYYRRDKRFAYVGLINEPGFKQASAPDEWGLCLDERESDAPQEPFDELVYGRPSGVVGLRIFPNPAFDEEAQERWTEAMDRAAFYLDPDFYSDRDLVRPYRVGMSCGFCHVSHHPLRPPEDPENPEWENLSGTIGAQYFWFGRVFAPNVGPDNLVWHILENQQPGAVDTSFVPTDNLNNPRAMNAIFNVPARLEIAKKIGEERIGGGALDLPEVQEKGPVFGVPHILWDGADSVGINAALTRVYINIGEYHQEWIRHFKPLVGGKEQSPITVKSAQENSTFWNATQERSGDLATYLIWAGAPMPLEDAPGGEAYLRGDLDEAEYGQVLERGKVVFAQNCARCHSSKLPEPIVGLGEGPGCGGRSYRECWDEFWGWSETDEFKRRMTELVMREDFLENNFLSTDARIPVDVLETEICSAMASNALQGHVWDNFVSQTYWDLPSVGEIELYDPVREQTFSWEAPGGGRGYQRVPSLVSIWSTAPLLHNNEIGKFTSDPSVEGRMAAFDDAIEGLLSPGERGEKVHRVEHEVEVGYPGNMRTLELDRVDIRIRTGALPALLQPLVQENWFLSLLRKIKDIEWLVDEGEVVVGPIPDGTPINLLTNLNTDPSERETGDLAKLVKVLIRTKNVLKETHRKGLSDAEEAERLRPLVPDLIELSACPDFVVDRGHEFGAELSRNDKDALIAYLKTL